MNDLDRKEIAGLLTRAMTQGTGEELVFLSNAVDDARTDREAPFIIAIIDAISMSGFKKMKIEAADRALKGGE